jgi:hypothetical protein
VSLTAVEREVPFGENSVEQAKAIVGAQIAPAAAPLVSAIPAGHDAARAVHHARTARPMST